MVNQRATEHREIQTLKEKFIYRFLEIIPGVLSWGTLLTAFLLSWIAPAAVAFFIIIFDFFWFLRVCFLSMHQIASFKTMKENLKVNWIEKLNNLPISQYSLPFNSWLDVYHLIILPTYKEDFKIIESTIQSLIDADYPKDKMIVVLTVEEKAGKKTEETAVKIKEKFGNIFLNFLITIHPQNISGEIAGKGSNFFWAAKRSRELLDSLAIPYENVIVSNFDIDTKPFPQYFSCLTWTYLTAKNPLRSSYQPIPIYNNNIWDVPFFSRLVATSGTFWQMMQQERPEQIVTYSSHAMPFKALNEVEYPRNVVSDDSTIFWKSYFYYNGDYRTIPLHYPISMDAVMATSFFKTAVNQYKQQRRWAWGCENLPYILYGFLKNKKIPRWEKLRHSFVIIEGLWSWAVSALLLFCLGWLPLFLGAKEFQISLLSYNLPRLTSYIMTATMIGTIISVSISMLMLPPRLKKVSRWKSVLMVFQWISLPIDLIIFGSFPALDAQMRLLLGKYMGFWVTEKQSPKVIQSESLS